MGIKNYITDPKNKKNAHIITHNDKDSNNALVTATHPLKIYENSIKFFIDTNFGIDMNIGIAIENTEYIHNGTDNVYWSATIISGAKWTVDSTDQNHTAVGSRSIKSDSGAISDTLQIAIGSSVILTNYNFITMWIYVDKDWAVGDNITIYGWDTGTGIIVGNSVNLEDYFSWGTFGSWQKLIIPLNNMNLTGEALDSIRIEIAAKDGKSPKFYMDDIQFEGLSSTAQFGSFIVEPESGTWLHIKDINIFMADDDYDSTEADSTVPKISYKTLLGVSALSSGIIYRREQNEIIEFSYSIKQLSDFFILPGTELVSYGSDGATNTWILIRVIITEPIILKSENKDKLSIIISEDLSGLDVFRASAGCKEEQRQQ